MVRCARTAPEQVVPPMPIASRNLMRRAPTGGWRRIRSLPVRAARPWLAAALLVAVPVAGPAAAGDVIVDADLGDDIDDAFAIALLLRAPELHVLGVTTAFGDTALRARLAAWMLRQAGRTEIPVCAGPPTPPRTRFTQARLAGRGPAREWPDAVGFTLRQLRDHPAHSITLLALAPASNIAAMIARDPVAFRRLARVVMMGGAIRVGYGGGSPVPEYNVAGDPGGMRRLLASGVPVSLLPLDSTQIPLGEMARDEIFAAGTGLTDALALAYAQWAVGNRWGTTPVLFDVVPVAVMIDPSLCPMRTLRITVGDDGMVRAGSGTPVSACLASHADRILSLLSARLGRPEPDQPAPDQPEPDQPHTRP